MKMWHRNSTFHTNQIWVFPEIVDFPKMDGENNGKPYFLMDDLGVPLLSETSILMYFVKLCLMSYVVSLFSAILIHYLDGGRG